MGRNCVCSNYIFFCIMQQIYLSVKIDLRKPLLISVVVYISEVDIFARLCEKLNVLIYFCLVSNLGQCVKFCFTE